MTRAGLVLLLLGGGCAAVSMPPAAGPVPAVAARSELDAALAELARALAPAAAPDRRVAVFAFPERGAGPTPLGGWLADRLVAALTAGGHVTVVERGRLDTLGREHRLAARGELDDATAAELGNLLGASAVVVGTLTRDGERVELQARLVGAQDGLVRHAGEARFPLAAVPAALAARAAPRLELALELPADPRARRLGEALAGELVRAGVADVHLGAAPARLRATITVEHLDVVERRHHVRHYYDGTFAATLTVADPATGRVLLGQPVTLRYSARRRHGSPEEVTAALIAAAAQEWARLLGAQREALLRH